MDGLLKHGFDYRINSSIDPLDSNTLELRPEVQAHLESTCTKCAEMETEEIRGHNSAPHILLRLSELKEKAKAILSDYGREIMITLKPHIYNTCTSTMVTHMINMLVRKYTKSAVILADYSPVDGRLHYHGVCNFENFNDISSLNKSLARMVGKTTLKMPRMKVINVDYIFKVYEGNKYTKNLVRYNEKNTIDF